MDGEGGTVSADWGREEDDSAMEEGRFEPMDEMDPLLMPPAALVGVRAVPRPLARGVESEPPPTGKGSALSGGDDAEGGEEMVVFAMASARSLAESSFDRVRPIFLEGDWPMARDG